MRYVIVLLAFLTLLSPAFSATVIRTVTWEQDPTQNINDLQSVLIYNISSGASVLLATASCTGATPNVVCPTTASITITLGDSYQIVARNYDGIQESANSNTIVTPGKPPKNLRR